MNENYADRDQHSYYEDLGFESIVDHPHLRENSLTRQALSEPNTDKFATLRKCLRLAWPSYASTELHVKIYV